MSTSKRLENIAKELGRDKVWNLDLQQAYSDNLDTDHDIFERNLEVSQEFEYRLIALNNRLEFLQ